MIGLKNKNITLRSIPKSSISFEEMSLAVFLYYRLLFFQIRKVNPILDD